MTYMYTLNTNQPTGLGGGNLAATGLARPTLTYSSSYSA